MAETFSAETLDSLIKDAVKSGTPIDGADGLLNEPTKSVLERALQTEMTHHLGYETGDPGRARVWWTRLSTTCKAASATFRSTSPSWWLPAHGSAMPAALPWVICAFPRRAQPAWTKTNLFP
ncbi:hypothetical protein BST21_05525 [Mycolicibacterium celeriflavum]|nr:hypothetical protein BST21_05525 [Mycolicibacterium celeriflavum]